MPEVVESNTVVCMTKKESYKKSSKEEERIIIDHKNKQIIVKNLSVRNDEVLNFLEDKSNREELVRKSIIIGTLGLKNMGLEMKVDYIDKRFKQFLTEIETKFNEHGEDLQKKLNDVFDIKNSDSPIFQLYKKIDDTFDENNKKSPMFKLAKHLEEYFDDKKGVVRNLINSTFDTKKKDSPIGKFLNELENYFNKDTGIIRDVLDKTFDIEDGDTPLGKLVNNLDQYFSDEGVLKKLLDSHFDLDNKRSSMSKFAKLLEENFDVDKGTIKILLDPNKDGSPVNQLRNELIKHFNEVKEKLSIIETERALIEKTTLKGGEFEDTVYEQLNEMTVPYGDRVKDVRNSVGCMGKCGDFLVCLRECEKDKIVFEVKNSHAYKSSISKTETEIENAMKNRTASFGIFIFKYREQLPHKLQPLKISTNYIIASSEGNCLYYAYRVGRILLESQRSRNDDKIPIKKIEKEINTLLERSTSIEDAIKKAKTIQSASESIETILKPLRTDIENSLERIKKYIGS